MNEQEEKERKMNDGEFKRKVVARSLPVVDKAKQCGNNAEVKYPSDTHAFSIAYDSYMEGRKDAEAQIDKAKEIIKDLLLPSN